jgi:hypothetical protein
LTLALFRAVAQLLDVRPILYQTFMNTKYKRWFEQTAADPARRRVAIADFTKRRAIFFCCALIVTGCAVVMAFTATHHPSAPMVESFAAFMSWIVVIRVNSDLRVLKLLDQISSRDDTASV